MARPLRLEFSGGNGGWKSLNGDASDQRTLHAAFQSSQLNDVRHQLLLGDDSFVEQYPEKKKPEELKELTKARKRSSDRLLALSVAFLQSPLRCNLINPVPLPLPHSQHQHHYRPFVDLIYKPVS